MVGIAAQRVAGLDHEVGDDAMEPRAVVDLSLASFSKLATVAGVSSSKRSATMVPRLVTMVAVFIWDSVGCGSGSVGGPIGRPERSRGRGQPRDYPERARPVGRPGPDVIERQAGPHRPRDAGEAGHRLQGPEHPPLFRPADAARHLAGEHRPRRRTAEGEDPDGGVEPDDGGDEGGGGEPGGHQQQPPHRDRPLAACGGHPSQQDALHQDADEAHQGEEPGGALRPEVEPRVREDREVRLEARHGEVHREEGEEDPREAGAPDRLAEVVEGVQVARAERFPGAALGRQRLREDQVAERRRPEREDAGGVRGCTQAPVAQDTAHRRADDEPEAEGGADEAEVLGAVLGRRHVRDVGLRRGDVAAGEPVDQPRQEEQPERVGRAENEVADRGAQYAEDQDAPPAD